MNTSEYVASVENLMNETKSRFKFELLQNVHHIGYKINGIISRRMYSEAPGDASIMYDVVLAGKETRVLSDVGEYFLADGHLDVLPD